jgi:hypothetical protein
MYDLDIHYEADVSFGKDKIILKIFAPEGHHQYEIIELRHLPECDCYISEQWSGFAETQNNLADK